MQGVLESNQYWALGLAVGSRKNHTFFKQLPQINASYYPIWDLPHANAEEWITGTTVSEASSKDSVMLPTSITVASLMNW